MKYPALDGIIHPPTNKSCIKLSHKTTAIEPICHLFREFKNVIFLYDEKYFPRK